MDILTIILFFIYTWGFGYTATFFLKNSENFFERNLMRLGIGLAGLVVASLLLNLLRIPIDWRIILALSLIAPLYGLFRALKGKKLNPEIRLTKSNIAIALVLIIFLATLFMYTKGAFSYPWLEDDDPWAHATGVEYVAVEKTAFVPEYAKRVVEYMDAYPPGYDVVMGLLHQTSSSLSWTLKFFNALVISLGIIFFYFFAKEFTGEKNKALFATFVIAMIPAFMSHFIWAHAFIPAMFFVVMYCLEMIKNDKKWAYPAMIAIASIPLIQPTQPVKVAILLLAYFAVKAAHDRTLLKPLLVSAAAGMIIAVALWWGPMILKYNGEILGKGLGYTGEDNPLAGEKSYIGTLGSATRLYNLRDFFWAETTNMINNPVGIGLAAMLLLLFSLFVIFSNCKRLLKKENSWILITLIWLLFTLMGLYGGTVLPFALETFMFWMLFAIPVALLAGEGISIISRMQKSKIVSIIIVSALIITVFLTSGYQKYSVNTALWGPGGWIAPMTGELNGLVWLKQNTPENAHVFVFGFGSFMAGTDKYSCEWCSQVVGFRKNLTKRSDEEMYNWLKKENYEYVMVSGYYVQEKGINETATQFNRLVSGGRLKPVYQFSYDGQPGLPVIFKVN